jgi:hypothetical protein
MDNLTLWVLGVVAEAASLCGEREWVLLLYEKLKPFDGLNVVMSWGSAFDGAVSHYLALLAHALEDRETARAHFEAALVANRSIDCPPLLARTKWHYANMLLQDHKPENTARGLRHLYDAIGVFDRLGMTGYLEQSQTVLEMTAEGVRFDQGGRGEIVGAMSSRTTAEMNEFIFRREVDFWTIAFERRMLRVRHTRGLAMLAVLLQRPDTEVHVLDLVCAIDGIVTSKTSEGSRLGWQAGSSAIKLQGDAGPLLDARARAEYRRRAEELRCQLVEAEQFNDVGRMATLSEQISLIGEELKRAYGRGGRSRVAASICERARVNVRNNLSAALKILKRADYGLWRHLDGSLRTGTVCAYRPERPMPWAF